MSNYGFYVERQGWTHWPKVLIMRHKTGCGPDEKCRYVPERTCHDKSKFVNVFLCSECGYEDDFITDPWQGPTFCARCGARIVGEDE